MLQGDHRVAEGIFLVRDIHSALVGMQDGVLPAHQYRIAVGYSGWGQGQLASELERDDWIIQACHPRLLFATRPDAMWSEAMRREDRPDIEPGSPPSPSMN